MDTIKRNPTFPIAHVVSVGRDSSVGMATGYGLYGPGNRIPVGSRFSTHLSRTAVGTNQPPVQWVPGLSRG